MPHCLSALTFCEGTEPITNAAPPVPDEPSIDLAKEHTRALVAQKILRVRRTRLQFFDSILFGEVAFEALLEIYAREATGGACRIDELQAGIAASPAQLDRWMKVLEGQELVIRVNCRLGSTVRFAELTPKGRQALDRYFEAVLKG